MDLILREPHLSEDGEAFAQFAGPRFEMRDDLREPAPNPRWYAVRTHARHEKRLRDHLVSRNIEVFLPVYEKISRWKNGCQARVELPLFPGYLFVEMDVRHRVRVLEIPGAISFVGTSKGPLPLCDLQMKSLRSSLNQRKFEPHAYLVAGQKVRIVKGPLANLTGILLRTNASPPSCTLARRNHAGSRCRSEC